MTLRALIAPLRARLPALLAALEAGLVERRPIVRLCLLTALAGEHSLLQQTVLRLSGLPNLAPPLVVCNEEHRFLVAEQLRAAGVEGTQILLEPAGRNTAPAVALAALHAQARRSRRGGVGFLENCRRGHRVLHFRIHAGSLAPTARSRHDPRQSRGPDWQPAANSASKGLRLQEQRQW